MEVIKATDYYNNLGFEFWDTWIGKEEFESNFLKKQLKFKKLVAIENGNLEGVFIYKKMRFMKIYKILLMAKKYNSNKKKIEKLFLNYFIKKYKGKLLLSDDSQIPNYYTKLGLKKTNNWLYKFLLNDWHFDIYTKNI